MYCRSHDRGSASRGVCIQRDLPAVGEGFASHPGGLPPGGLYPGGFASRGSASKGQTPHRYYSIQSTGWRYASHWNAFLLFDIVLFCCCLGLASATVPMYIAECTLPHNRGRLVTVFNTCVAGGQCVAGLIDGCFFTVNHGWR